MADIKVNKAKEKFVNEIIQDINEIPFVYMKTLYALIHTFKENILTIENIEINTNIEVSDDETNDFDWDNLLDEIHQNRQINNLKLSTKISQLLTE
jgi:hypothetical protein